MTIVDMSSFRLLEARQHAINALMREFNKVPDDLRVIDYHLLGKSWYAGFVSKDFPDITVEVVYHADKEQVWVDLFKRVDRMTVNRKHEWVFNPITLDYSEKEADAQANDHV